MNCPYCNKPLKKDYAAQQYCMCLEWIEKHHFTSKSAAKEKELPERFYANPFDLSFDTKKQIICIMETIDRILEYLKQNK